jgi:dTMP kinase
MTGLFVSLDGLDGTGKSTQCRLLAEWLREQGRTVVQAIDPGGTPFGQEIRQILLGGRHELTPACEALLFMASRAQLVAQVIRPALEAGAVVVCDRFVTSTLVYQGHAGGLDVGLLRDVGRLAVGGDRLDHAGILPQRVYLLDLPVEEAVARRGREADRIERRPPDYHERVRQGFLTEARRDPSRFRIVDARAEVDAIQHTLRTDLAELLR